MTAAAVLIAAIAIAVLVDDFYRCYQSPKPPAAPSPRASGPVRRPSTFPTHMPRRAVGRTMDGRRTHIRDGGR